MCIFDEQLGRFLRESATSFPKLVGNPGRLAEATSKSPIGEIVRVLPTIDYTLFSYMTRLNHGHK